MRKTLAASALGAAVLLAGPQVAAHAEPSATPTSVSTSTSTSTSTTTTKDYTGLWGLLGLAGLAGLAGRRRPETHVTPVHTTPVRTETHTTPVRTETHTTGTYTEGATRTTGVNDRVDNLRQGDLNNDGRRDI